MSNRTAVLELDEEIGQRFIFVGRKYNKITGNDKGRSYVYTKEYADANGIPYYVENWDQAKPGEWILSADKSHIIQVMSKSRPDARFDWLRTSTRSHILNRSAMKKCPPDWIPALDRYNFGGKVTPDNELKRLNRKQIEVAFIVAYNIIRHGRVDFVEAIKQAYDNTNEKSAQQKARRLVNRHVFQETVAMTMANILAKAGLTPEFTLGKIKEFIEDKDANHDFRYGVLKDLMYIQGVPLKELEGKALDPRIPRNRQASMEAIEAEYKELQDDIVEHESKSIKEEIGEAKTDTSDLSEED